MEGNRWFNGIVELHVCSKGKEKNEELQNNIPRVHHPICPHKPWRILMYRVPKIEGLGPRAGFINLGTVPLLTRYCPIIVGYLVDFVDCTH
jgi:hypothetical protein